MSALGWTFFFTVIAAGAVMLGGFVITMPARLGERRLNHLIAFGAGFMLGAAFVSMIPEAFELTARAPLWILVGYVLAHLFEHAFTPHFHFGEETHAEHAVAPGVSTSALVGLSLHAFFDGVAISAGFLISPGLGIFIALAVILHKIPEGVTIASVMVAAGGGKGRARGSTALVAIATVVGALLMSAQAPYRAPALGLSSGIAVYVAATDLMPEINKRQEREFSLSALLGVAFYFGVYWLLHAVGIHE